MSECMNAPGQECKAAAKIARLEERVNRLEDDHQKEADFRRTYYADREARVKHDAELQAKVDGMDGKLDKLVEWKEGEQSKPDKLLDKIKENALWAICAAVIAYCLAQVGL